MEYFLHSRGCMGFVQWCINGQKRGYQEVLMRTQIRKAQHLSSTKLKAAFSNSIFDCHLFASLHLNLSKSLKKYSCYTPWSPKDFMRRWTQPREQGSAHPRLGPDGAVGDMTTFWFQHWATGICLKYSKITWHQILGISEFVKIIWKKIHL